MKNRTDSSRTSNRILEALTSRPNSSRYELSQIVGCRVSTVCSTIAALSNRGLVKVSGSKTDLETGKVVETLAVTSARAEAA